MTAPTTETADVPPADLPAPERPRRRGVERYAVVVAVVGLAVALVGVAAMLRPLTTPTQDCGTAASFLLGGELNEYVDPDAPPDGVTAAEARENNEHPCQERAANQARPAAVLVAGGTVLALGAAITELVVRNLARRRERRRRHAPPEDPVTGEPSA